MLENLLGFLCFRASCTECVHSSTVLKNLRILLSLTKSRHYLVICLYSIPDKYEHSYFMKDIPPSARRCAAEILVEVMDSKRPFDETLLRHAAFQQLDERDRNFVRLMVMTCLRHIGQIDDVLARMLEKPLSGKSNDVMHCLRLGVVQLLWLKTPPHAAVHAMVDTVAEFGHERMKGLVNVVLKRVAKEGKGIIASQDAAKINVPGWLFESWRKTYGEKAARAIALPRESAVPLDITVKGDAGKWAQELGGIVLPTGTVRIVEAGRVDMLVGFSEGEWWVQDAAAALPVQMLGDVAGKIVFDICAAPGGKTAQLAVAGAKVIAVDQSRRRLQILQSNMDRLKLDVQAVESDMLRWRTEIKPDIVLLDAPCSATGTLRRHPEVIWHKKKEDIAELAALQKRMLNRAANWLGAGGKLLYCVCSLQPEEGEEQIENFLSTHPNFSIIKAFGIPAEFINKQGALRTLPSYLADSGGMDGFYAVVLEKKS